MCLKLKVPDGKKYLVLGTLQASVWLQKERRMRCTVDYIYDKSIITSINQHKPVSYEPLSFWCILLK